MLRCEGNCCGMENKRRHWWAAIPTEDMSWWIQAHFNRLAGRLCVYLPITVNAQISRQPSIRTLFCDSGIMRAMDACGSPRMNESSQAWLRWATFSDQQHCKIIWLHFSPISIVSCVMGAVAVKFCCSCSACLRAAGPYSKCKMICSGWIPSELFTQQPRCSAVPSPHEPYSAF